MKGNDVYGLHKRAVFYLNVHSFKSSLIDELETMLQYYGCDVRFVPMVECESWSFNEETIVKNYNDGKVSYIVSTMEDFLEPYIIKEKKTSKKKAVNTAGCKMKQGRIDNLLGANMRV